MHNNIFFRSYIKEEHITVTYSEEPIITRRTNGPKGPAYGTKTTLVTSGICEESSYKGSGGIHGHTGGATTKERLHCYCLILSDKT